jgi:methyl-accepting chemotaxis protein
MQVGGTIDTLMSNTQTNSVAAEELAATAEEMNAQVMQLQHMMSYFKVERRLIPR